MFNNDIIEKYKYFYDGRIKECTKCNRLLTIDNFIKDRTKPYGIYSSCKACYKLDKGIKSKRVPLRERDCVICNKSFIPRHWQKDNNYGITCSIACRGKYVGMKRRTNTKTTTHSGYTLTRDSVNDDLKREHVKVIEKHIGRSLDNGEIVHHIDCNKSNNNLKNLYLCNKSTHMVAHASLNTLVEELIKNDVIFFDKLDGIYLVKSNYYGPPL